MDTAEIPIAKQKEAKEATHFSSPLPKLVRFYTALKITSQLYRPQRSTPTDILFMLLREGYYDIRSENFMAAIGHAIGDGETDKMREFFTEVYNDEQLIIDWLNKKINQYYFAKKKKLKNGKDETWHIVNAIMQENGVFGLLDTLE